MTSKTKRWISDSTPSRGSIFGYSRVNKMLRTSPPLFSDFAEIAAARFPPRTSARNRIQKPNRTRAHKARDSPTSPCTARVPRCINPPILAPSCCAVFPLRPPSFQSCEIPDTLPCCPLTPVESPSPLSPNKAHPTYRPFSLHEEATRPVSVRHTANSSVSLSLPSFPSLPSEQHPQVSALSCVPALARSFAVFCFPSLSQSRNHHLSDDALPLSLTCLLYTSDAADE